MFELIVHSIDSELIEQKITLCPYEQRVLFLCKYLSRRKPLKTGSEIDTKRKST